MKIFKLIKSHKKICIALICAITLISIIYAVFFNCKNPYIEKNGLVYKNCSFAYFKIIGIKDSSMFMTYDYKAKYQDIGVAPQSLLIWFPENEKQGTLKIFHSQFGYKDLPLDDEGVKALVPADKIKSEHFITTPLELKYRITDKEIELSKDGKKWYHLWIRVIKSNPIQWEDNDIPLPYNKIDLFCRWFEGEYEYIWDSRITIEEQIKSIDTHYNVFLRSK